MSGLYLSSVEGHLVTRFGTTRRVAGVPCPGLLIGAERDPTDPCKVVMDTSRVVFIPDEEARAFAREYARAVREGALRVRTEAEYKQRAATSPDKEE